MNKQLIKALKIILPLGLGIFLIWLAVRGLKPDDIAKIKLAFQQANYGWVILSLVPALLSHASRAYRWKYTMEPLGMHPRFVNSFFTVMIAYFVNMGIPRSGEVARVALMSRYEKLPFNKLLGTVIAERVTDLLILLSIMATVLVLQLPIAKPFLEEQLAGKEIPFFLGPWFLIAFSLGGLIGAILVFRWLRNSAHPFAQKVLEFFRGIFNGIRSLLTMPKKWWFIGHTAFIWCMYILMFYVCFFALPGTRQIPISGVMAAFVLGGLAITITPGGLGAYPTAIAGVLALYGLDGNTGLAFGWIVWSVQTLMLIVVGAIGLLVLPIYNKRSASLHAPA